MFIMRRKKNQTAARVFVTLAVASVSSGCAMKGDIRLVQEELRTIAARQDSLMAVLAERTASTQDTLRTQGDQMFDLRGDLNRQLQQISQSLVRLEAIAGQNQQGLIAVRDQLANTRTGGTTVSVPMGGNPAGGGESLIGGAGNPDELWSVAQEQYQRQSFSSATAAFQQFIEEHPDDPRVPDAHFFLADILVQQERPEDALAAFQEVQRLFPSHERVPDALFRIGTLQMELDDVDAARLTFERLVNTYPEHPLSMIARDTLDEIG